MRILQILLQLLFFLFLTLLTQVGGIVWLAGMILSRKLTIERYSLNYRRMIRGASQVLWYLVCTFLIIPLIAGLFGRVPLPTGISGPLKPRTLLTVLCNRHYVHPALRSLVEEEARDLARQQPGLYINYLDANFPFSFRISQGPFRKGFPLLPHLSHSDGRKLDIAFIYREASTGKWSKKTPSAIGYGISEEPLPGEYDRPSACRTSFSYNFMHDHWPQSSKAAYQFDAEATREMIKAFASHPKIGKVLLEPHLKQRLSLGYGKITGVQCGSVRHDDHVHIQLW